MTLMFLLVLLSYPQASEFLLFLALCSFLLAILRGFGIYRQVAAQTRAQRALYRLLGVPNASYSPLLPMFTIPGGGGGTASWGSAASSNSFHPSAPPFPFPTIHAAPSAFYRGFPFSNGGREEQEQAAFFEPAATAAAAAFPPSSLGQAASGDDSNSSSGSAVAAGTVPFPARSAVGGEWFGGVGGSSSSSSATTAGGVSSSSGSDRRQQLEQQQLRIRRLQQHLGLQLALLHRDLQASDYDLLRALDADNPPPVAALTDEEIARLPAFPYQAKSSPSPGSACSHPSALPLAPPAAAAATVAAAVTDTKHTKEQRADDEEDGRQEVGERCTVCLESFQEEEIVRLLPCLHQFHSQCIDEWLHRQATCPICKHRLVLS